MSTETVTMVRMYLDEKNLKQVLNLLHDEEQVRGVTVFRGISGFGKSGRYHAATLLDLGSHLPVVVEFFDKPEKVKTILQHFREILEPGHIVHWQAEVTV